MSPEPHPGCQAHLTRPDRRIVVGAFTPILPAITLTLSHQGRGDIRTCDAGAFILTPTLSHWGRGGLLNR